MKVEKLLPPEKLLRLGQSLAMLDAILFDDWEDRLYSFDLAWWLGKEAKSIGY